MPRNFVGSMALEIYRVEALPQLLFGALGDGVQAQLALCLEAPGVETVLQLALAQLAGQARLGGVKQILEQLRLPGVPDFGAGAADIGDRQ